MRNADPVWRPVEFEETVQQSDTAALEATGGLISAA
jgi:hypothetical protein